MADLSHLDKMGKELKCPICWNLLSSAVSLVCNHVFCNSCILESMKSVSDCPVCKVPFHQKEVCPAPHMDNLVSIYKNIESATWTNKFSTQLPPSAKSSEDRLAQGNDDKIFGSAETAVAHQGKSKRKGLSEKMQKGIDKSDARISDCYPSKMPSFPAKKRIHVMPYPVSETPVCPEKMSELGDSSIKLKDDKETKKNEKPAQEEQGDPSLSPFFWLREEEENNETADKQSGQQTADTPPPHNVPCFSDIKESDYESPVKNTPTSKSNAAIAFASEMFEWTQRACSPELCSTPLKEQTVGTLRLDGIQEKDCQNDLEIEIASGDGVPHKNVETRIAETRKGTFKNRRKNGKLQKRHVKSSISRTSCMVYNNANKEIPTDFGEVAQDSSQENEETDKMSRTSGRKILKQCNDPAIHHQTRHLKFPTDQVCNSTSKASEQHLTISTRSKYKNEEMGVRDIADKANKRGKDSTMKSQRKRIKKAIDYSVVCIKKSIDDSAAKILKEIPANSIIEAKTQNPNCHKKSIEHDKISGNGCLRRGKKNQEKQLGESNAQRRMKNQNADLVVTKDAVQIPPTMKTSLDENIISAINLHQESEGLVTKNKTKFRCHTLGDNILRKCENNHIQIQCAFCQSTHDTEDSGEMMHYFNGKPVIADFNGGVNVIHSHKNCTEWAPAVYFQDDMAINLAAEITRSRRIKCNCCGIKGAALGCFEKSCRKSFHFTCAKLIPECRWDSENFVMLCPLHVSSKLPIEISEPQNQTRKSSIPKGVSLSQISSVSKRCNEKSQMWTWASVLPHNWVICCSALSAAEKDILSEFTKMTGVPISKTWSPAVTHVIASTDKNGACKRTLEFLMAILNGKWILSIDWINACMEAREPVDEGKYEITVNQLGISGGPQLGRLREINKQPKLFNGISFYFSGDHTPCYNGCLQDLVIKAGGTILQRKPISRDQEKLLDDSLPSSIFIIYDIEHPEKNRRHDYALVFNHRRAEAQALAHACGGKVATNVWIVDSIAACQLQPLI